MNEKVSQSELPLEWGLKIILCYVECLTVVQKYFPRHESSKSKMHFELMFMVFNFETSSPAYDKRLVSWILGNPIRRAGINHLPFSQKSFMYDPDAHILRATNFHCILMYQNFIALCISFMEQAKKTWKNINFKYFHPPASLPPPPSCIAIAGALECQPYRNGKWYLST